MDGLRTPHSNKLSATAGAGKKCYFIIFSLRTCLGCARNASFSVPFWSFPGVLWPPGGPRTPENPKSILSGTQVPKCSKRAFGRHYRAAGLKKCFFGKICQQIFSSITSKVHGGRAAPPNGQNEGAILENIDFFRSASADRHTHIHTHGQRTNWPSTPPPPRRKKSSRGRASHPPLQQTECHRRRRKKLLLYHFQPPHLPGVCQERILLRASCGS